MPELPEVETIVSDLRGCLLGMRFCRLEGLLATDSAAMINGATVSGVERRGKFINIFFENGFVMTIHLRMSGRILFEPADSPPLPFERTVIHFDKATLRFCDVRKFGRLWIAPLDEYEKLSGIERLGVEPFECDANVFRKLLKGKKGAIKKLLLDQSLLAGVGNIYADEACFYAGFRPGHDVVDLKDDELDRLFEAVLKALSQGIRNRGTSISDFADAYGKPGKNQELLYVYGRGGLDCLKCGGVLEKTKLAGRGTVFCRHCQN